MLEKSINSHIDLMRGEVIQAICKPFFDATGITHFIYNKIYQNGQCVWLSNRLDWFCHYFQKKYYTIGAFEQKIETYIPGFYLWAGIEENEIGIDARNDFNIDNGISIVDNQKTFCEFYHFASTRDNHNIINFYINNIDLIKNFTFLFKEKAREIIWQAEQHHILLFNQQPIVQIENQPPAIASKKMVNSKLFQPKRYFLKGGFQKYVTRREYDCITLLAKGKTNKEIAVLLSISVKAVELYTNSAKDRLNMATRAELIQLQTQDIWQWH